MKQKSNISSFFSTFGISPATIVIILLALGLSGVFLGLLVNNSTIKRPKNSDLISASNTNQLVPVKLDEPNIDISINEKTTSEKALLNDTSVISQSDIDENKREEVRKAILKELNKIEAEKEKTNLQVGNNDAKPELIPETPYNKFKIVPKEAIKTPIIAIVIDDMGVNMVQSQKILTIPYDLTLSYLTYAPNLQSQIDQARAINKEILLHVPMEALSNSYDYGPEFLSTKTSRDDNVKLLNTMLSRGEGYIGINNHMGSKFTESTTHLTAVIEELNKKGLMFLDSRTSPKSKADDITTNINIPYISRDIFLDDSPKKQDIENSLSQLEAIATKRGYAVAIGHPRKNTIEILEAWLPTLKEKGITVVPLSSVVDFKNNKK